MAFVDNMTVEQLMTQSILCQPQASNVLSTNGVLTLVITSASTQEFTGTGSGFSTVLPDARTLIKGWRYEFVNRSNQTVAVKDATGFVLFTLDSNSVAYLQCVDTTTQAGTWFFWQVLASSIASGILNYNLVSSAAFTTTSTTDVLVTGFSITPTSGKYAVFYNGSSFLTTTPKAHWWSVFRGGTKIGNTERTQDTGHSNQNMVDSTMTVENFNGSQTCDIRVRTSNGTLTINARSLILIRLGPPI